MKMRGWLGQVFLAVCGLLAYGESWAITWPAYCQQSGGTMECNTNSGQSGSFSCDANPTFQTATADACYDTWLTRHSDLMNTNNAPRMFIFIASPNDGRDVLTLTGSSNGQRNTVSYSAGCANFGCPYSFNVMVPTSNGLGNYGNGAVPYIKVNYECPAGYDARPLPDASNPYNSTFNPRTSQPDIICSRPGVAPPPVVCPAGQKPHPYGGCMLDCPVGSHANLQNTACVLNDSCPIPHLTPLPIAATDQCSAALESNSSENINRFCPKLSTELKNGLICLQTKVANLSSTIPFKVTATIRSAPYQAHMRDVWEQMERLVVEMRKAPALQIACAARRAELAAEKGCDKSGACKRCSAETATNRSHCIKASGGPAKVNLSKPGSAKHTEGNAFDVNEETINAVERILGSTKTIPQLLLESPSCGLTWGGTFKDVDRVHFQFP